jgi:hypothetical protein
MVRFDVPQRTSHLYSENGMRSEVVLHGRHRNIADNHIQHCRLQFTHLFDMSSIETNNGGLCENLYRAYSRRQVKC